MTKLCVAITVHSLEQALSDATRAAENGADLVEYRVDTFTELDDVRFLVGKSPVPCVVTCRPTWEGGNCDLPDQERIPVLEAASLAGAAYIDVELVAYRRSANLRQKVHFNAGAPVDRTAPRPDRKGMIVSSHDFAGRPPTLTKLAAEIADTGTDVVKLAWTARSVRDNLEAFELLRHRAKPTIALCMGEAGFMSRVLAPKFGGFLTFAALDEGRGTAPGQPTLRELLELYRFRAIKPSTAVFGVVGHPISHSLSPHVHNHHFALRGDDAVYLPFPVAPSYDAFKAFMETVARDEHLHLRGLSVTLPHKEHAFRYLNELGAEIDPLAAATGAVNTIRVRPGHALSGTSTDHGAILHCLRLGRTQAGLDPSLKGLRVAVLGAGGTGRTAVAALAAEGATVVVYNRTLDRAQQLAAEFDGKTGHVVAAPLDSLCKSCCHAYVQTTTLGMKPKPDESAWGDGALPDLKGAVVFDSVYTPMDTRLLRQAREAGATVVPGVEMFAHQAAAQYTFWTDNPADPAPFRARAEQELLARQKA